MNRLSVRLLRPVFLLALIAPGFWLAAHAEDESPENISAHIQQYTQEVQSMRDTLDDIVRDYAAGEDVAARVDALVGTWEEVGIHEAVETHAMPLYPPIWTALGGLSEAVAQKSAEPEVRRWRDRVVASLYQALGALKLAASRQREDDVADKTRGEAAAAGGADTIAIIQRNLDQVLQYYRNGDNQAASQLIQRTYLQRFEGIEGDLIAQDADLVTELEKDFNADLPLLIEREADADELDAEIESMKRKLDRAGKLLEAVAEQRGSVF